MVCKIWKRVFTATVVATAETGDTATIGTKNHPLPPPYLASKSPDAESPPSYGKDGYVWNVATGTLADPVHNEVQVIENNMEAKLGFDVAIPFPEIESHLRVDVASDQNTLLVLADKDGGIFAKFTLNGEFFIPGLRESVQSAVLNRKQLADSMDFGEIRHPLDIFSPESLAILTCRQGTDGCPPPMTLLPSRRRVNDNWIGQLRSTQPKPVRVITPYDPLNGVAHPCVVEFYNGFRGYRYILGLTPYHGAQDLYENPCIYGSNDLVNFDLLEDFEQPLAPKPDVAGGHNSDIFLSYDPRSGYLICGWRRTMPADNGSVDRKNSLWCRKTKDGRTWTEPELIMGETLFSTEMSLSPALLYDPDGGRWHMYSVGTDRLTPGGPLVYVVRHRHAPNYKGPWNATGYAIIQAPAGIKPWHVDVRYVGNRVVMLIHDNTAGNFYFGVSNDWDNWFISNVPVLQEPQHGVYKGTFLPAFDDGGRMAMDLLWTSNQKAVNPNDRWTLFVNRTNYVDVG